MLCVSAALLTACASTPETHYYTLEAVSSAPISQTATVKKPLVGIGPLNLPALLDRQQIVTRAQNNSLQMAEFDQWAAPLQDNAIAVVSKNVSALLPNAIVRAYPWSVYGNVDYRVIVDITRFDSQLGKSAILEASWAIMAEKNHTVISNGQTAIKQPLTDTSYFSATQALSKLLAGLSRQLALAVVEVQQK
ncbi:MAG: PqiC family protein [Methylococcales bacterium]|nr:PqiC family protein [Methylococcales bacterium]